MTSSPQDRRGPFALLVERWTAFWRAGVDFILAMDPLAVDPDPMQDIHNRVRRLEAAVFGDDSQPSEDVS